MDQSQTSDSNPSASGNFLGFLFQLWRNLKFTI